MDKLKKLRSVLSGMGSTLLAFSGGVDSGFLAAAAKEALGKNVLLVTAVSETYPAGELKHSKMLSKRLGMRQMITRTEELKDRRFKDNPPERCYYCKKELFSKLKNIAKKKGLNTVIDASNIDDLKDFRPGSRAKKELGIRSPLQEAQISKCEIRKFSRKLGLPTWDRPSAACLASRLPYGEAITEAKLKKIGTAEDFLKKQGFLTVRVRHHGNIARIELGPGENKRIFKSDIMDIVTRKLRDLGFKYITLDLEGFRSGSMNEVLPKIKRRTK